MFYYIFRNNIYVIKIDEDISYYDIIGFNILYHIFSIVDIEDERKIFIMDMSKNTFSYFIQYKINYLPSFNPNIVSIDDIKYKN
jgi:hypothetical protein